MSIKNKDTKDCPVDNHSYPLNDSLRVICDLLTLQPGEFTNLPVDRQAGNTTGTHKKHKALITRLNRPYPERGT